MSAGNAVSIVKKEQGSLVQLPGADPGLILGYCKTLQKIIEHRNDVIFRKIIDSARYSFDYSMSTDLKVQFDSNKKHSRG